MAIYHLAAKIISRGAGRLAFAAEAYMGCNVITNEYDGIPLLVRRPGQKQCRHERPLFRHLRENTKGK